MLKASIVATTRLSLLGLILSNSFLVAIPVGKGQPKGPISYAEIGERLIASYGVVDTGKSTDKEKGSDDLPFLPDSLRHQLLFSMLDTHGSYKVEVHDERVYSALRNLLEDLEVYFSSDDSDHANHVFSRLNYTSTTFGEVVLAKMLATMSANPELLGNRRALIEALLQDEAFFNRVAGLVKVVQSEENGMLSFWIDQGATAQRYVDNLYYDDLLLLSRKQTRQLNKNTLALELGTRFEVFRQFWPLFHDIFIAVGSNAIFEKNTNAIENKSSLGKLLWDAFNECHNPVANILWLRDIYQKKSDKKILDWINPEKLKEARALLGLRATTQIFTSFMMTLNKIIALKSIVKNFKMTKDTLLQMQRHLMSVRKIVDVVKELDVLAQRYPAMNKGLVTYANKNSIATKKGEFGRLLQLLATPTFEGKPSFYSHMGNVLVANKLMGEHKDKLVGILELLGELDACLSIAKLIKKYSSERMHYCLVGYGAGQKPSINLTNFWNPMVNHLVVVPNSINLGGNQVARNMVVTGSNTGGKSTILKGVALNALLAQTLCVAAADSCEIAPYAYIGSSLNIVDNIAGGKSLFQSEVDRAVGLVQAVESLSGRGHCLLIIDELFRGTTPDRAQQETYNFARHFATFANTNFILATHYVQQVTTLEEETQQICKNYKIEIKRDEHGHLVRPFKLEPGINTSNVATDIIGGVLPKQAVAGV